MIHIPLDIQLKWIREDLEVIKQSLFCIKEIDPPTYCPDCLIAQSLTIPTCPLHSPEFRACIPFPME